jgi:predicted SnoaL-like aldol condensation-catalyzing enzyme
MALSHYPVGLEMDVTFDVFTATLTLISDAQLKFEIKDGPFAHSETVDIHVVPLGNSLFAVSWKEATGASVTHVQDYDRGVIHSHAALTDGQFLRMSGPIKISKPAVRVSDERPRRNKALVIEAMTSLFQRHDAAAVERLYAPDYVQHNPHIPQGRAALKTLVEQLSPKVYYDPGLILAEGDFVAIHGLIRGWAEAPQVVVDLFRIEGGQLAEHWDVLQDEVSAAASLTGVAMFDPDEAQRAPNA